MEILDLVDKQDQTIGEATREQCHKQKLRHRAIQVFVLNSKGEIFLQKRSPGKDVFPGFYEASFSGHVRKGEGYRAAAAREMKEELGLDISEDELEEKFRYEVLFEPEHEILELFLFRTDADLKINHNEIAEGRLISMAELDKMISNNPEKFTPGFLSAWERFKK